MHVFTIYETVGKKIVKSYTNIKMHVKHAKCTDEARHNKNINLQHSSNIT